MVTFGLLDSPFADSISTIAFSLGHDARRCPRTSSASLGLLEHDLELLLELVDVAAPSLELEHAVREPLDRVVVCLALVLEQHLRRA